MSRLFFIAILSVVALCSGCSGKGAAQAADTADNFIENYYRADYAQAMNFVEPSLGELIEQVQQSIDELPEDVKEELVSLSSQNEVVRKDLQEGENGEVMVWYDVIIPAEGEIVNHLVTVVFSEERQRWEVVEIR
ncbi:MAG: hypothetical protein J6U71_06280 [Bacteroidales bacterium]|jgi:TolA-binding protein|nr:hypothetical protein [Bacteroidales bacterium]MBO7256540.1 hypothetical protein [Bacteroidales bacterium]MBO7284650.1 hypothetical protein [Bacteroidales bacterium]MBO7323546.1 hypothetical protein [Bacteroidales bacterium]MBQ5748173.1 hypothetical protein [Bacteroidales bacterium]